MLVAIALANKMARQFWAMLTKNEDYVVRRLRRLTARLDSQGFRPGSLVP